MSAAKKVEFRFDDSSLESIEKLKERGVKFLEIVIKDRETGAERVICIPDLKAEDRA